MMRFLFKDNDMKDDIRFGDTFTVKYDYVSYGFPMITGILYTYYEKPLEKGSYDIVERGYKTKEESLIAYNYYIENQKYIKDKRIDDITTCSMNELLKKYELAKKLVENIEKELVTRKGIGI